MIVESILRKQTAAGCISDSASMDSYTYSAPSWQGVGELNPLDAVQSSKCVRPSRPIECRSFPAVHHLLHPPFSARSPLEVKEQL